jgi:CheY-like chemotaxis protein
MRVLIADDDPTCREIVRHLLVRAGHQVTSVADGAAARAALLREPFGAALLDLQMPELDGAEVARAARAALPAAVRPRLIALTAAADPGAEARFLALGFDACVGKPIRTAALLAALSAP